MADRVEGSTYSNTGGVSRWTADSPNPEQVKEAEYNPSAHRGGAVTFNAHTGTVETRGVSSVQMDDRGSSDPLDRGRTQAGVPRARHQLALDDLVTVGGSEGRVRELVGLGVLEPDPAGGFKWRNQKPSQEAGASRPFDQSATDHGQQPSAGAEQQQEPGERLDPAVEGTIGEAVKRLGDQQVVALFEHTVRGNDIPNMAEIATRLNMEPEHAQAAYDRTVSAFVKQAQAAATTAGVDADAWDDFCEWARIERPNEKHKAESEHFEHGRTGGIRALAKEYAATGRQYDEASLLNAQLGDGIKVYRDTASGKVMLSAHGQTMPLRQAIQTGVVRISRKR